MSEDEKNFIKENVTIFDEPIPEVSFSRRQWTLNGRYLDVVVTSLVKIAKLRRSSFLTSWVLLY